MKKIIIIGASNFSSLMRLYIEDIKDSKVVAYAIEARFLNSEEFDNLPLVSIEKLESYYSPSDYYLLNTIGYTNMMSERKRIHEICLQKKYSIINYIHPSSVINSPIGDGSIVLENVSIGYRCHIGIGEIFWMNSVVAHDTSIDDFVYCAPSATILGHCQIGTRCFIGGGAVIRNGICIASECIIGAGVYMNRSIDTSGHVIRSPYPKLLTKKSLDIF